MEPLQITGIVIVQQASGDLAVRLERADGRPAVVTGANYHLEGQPFADVFAVWAFLIWQDPALRVDLVQRALDDYDPSWEEVVAARLRENDAASARARGELPPLEAEAQRRLNDWATVTLADVAGHASLLGERLDAMCTCGATA